MIKIGDFIREISRNPSGSENHEKSRIEGLVIKEANQYLLGSYKISWYYDSSGCILLTCSVFEPMTHY